jgi:hypothetical protein
MEILGVPSGAKELPLLLELGLAGLAVLSTMYVMFTYFFFSGQRNERRLYLSYVAASKLLTASLTMAGRAVRPEGWLCAAFGTAYIVADVVSVLWMAVVFAHAHEQQTDQPPTPRWRYHACVWTLSAAIVGGMFLLFGEGNSVADVFPQKREAFEHVCSISTSHTVARAVVVGLPIALGIHFTAVRFYFYHQAAVEKATSVHMTQEQKGQGYMLGAEEMKLLGSAAQRRVRFELRVAVTLRQFLLVMVTGRAALLAEIFYRTTVQNELLPSVYACRALSGPLETLAFVAVFEFRGKFFEKYMRRLQKKARKQHNLLRQNLQGSEMLKDVGSVVQRGVVGSSGKVLSIAVTAGQVIHSQQGDLDQQIQAIVSRRAATSAELVMKTHGMVYMATMRLFRNLLKAIGTVILIPVALAAWVPLYFIENFISSWRRRSGEREMTPFRLYLLSLLWFGLLMAPYVIFSHVVSDHVAAGSEQFARVAYAYLAVVYVSIIYGFWTTRWDPTMATIPDPRPNNRVRGNWFEGSMGYGILVYEFIAFTSMSFLSKQFLSRMDGSMERDELMLAAKEANGTMIPNGGINGTSDLWVAWEGPEAWNIMYDRVNAKAAAIDPSPGEDIDDATDLVQEVSLSVAVLNFFNEYSFAAQFYMVYALSFVWVLLWVLPIVVTVMWSPAAANRMMGAPIGPFSWRLIQFVLSDLCFIAIARGLLAAVDCHWDPIKEYVQVDMTAKAINSLECWTGDHLWYSNLALAALFIFLPTATLGKITEYTPGQDMRWIPVWVRVDLFSRSALLLLVLHTDASRFLSVVANVIGIGIHVMLLWASFVMRPCCVFWANWAKLVRTRFHFRAISVPLPCGLFI